MSPSEHPAFEVLLNAFKAGNPDVEVDRRRHRRRRRQQRPGRARRAPAGRRSSRRLADVPRAVRCAPGLTPAGSSTCPACYESSGLDRTMPPTLLEAATYRVKAWGVPTGSHRGNVLWFSQRVLREAGVTPPGPGYTMEAFEADLAKVAASGKTALCLGGKDRFTVDRAVREHSARSGRHRRMGQDSRRFVRLAGIPTSAGARRSTERSSPKPIRPRPASRGIRRRRSWRPDSARSCR